MPKHSNRCLVIKCDFTHPSKQVNIIYPSGKYRYSFPADDADTRRKIIKHAKRKYASEQRIRHMWIGMIDVDTSIKNGIQPDTLLTEKYNIVP